MPAMTAAFASLERSELSDATPQLNVLQRVGGSIGTAVLAVVLQRALVGAHTPGRGRRGVRHGVLVRDRADRAGDHPLHRARRAPSGAPGASARRRVDRRRRRWRRRRRSRHDRLDRGRQARTASRGAAPARQGSQPRGAGPVVQGRDGGGAAPARTRDPPARCRLRCPVRPALRPRLRRRDVGSGAGRVGRPVARRRSRRCSTRLEAAGLVARLRSEQDRRVVLGVADRARPQARGGAPRAGRAAVARGAGRVQRRRAAARARPPCWTACAAMFDDLADRG